MKVVLVVSKSQYAWVKNADAPIVKRGDFGLRNYRRDDIIPAATEERMLERKILPKLGAFHKGGNRAAAFSRIAGLWIGNLV